MEKIIVTGSCGFIGFNFIKSLNENYEIIGVDSINDAYDPRLKELRLEELEKMSNFKFLKIDSNFGFDLPFIVELLSKYPNSS